MEVSCSWRSPCGRTIAAPRYGVGHLVQARTVYREALACSLRDRSQFRSNSNSHQTGGEALVQGRLAGNARAWARFHVAGGRGAPPLNCGFEQAFITGCCSIAPHRLARPKNSAGVVAQQKPVAIGRASERCSKKGEVTGLTAAFARLYVCRDGRASRTVCAPPSGWRRAKC